MKQVVPILSAAMILSLIPTHSRAQQAGAFADDVAFLKTHVEVIVLSDAAGDAQVAVVPRYQGRVMTSTAGGPDGDSYGWVNRELIASGELQPHINVYGGEDRFWMGPEGGQFSIFFPKGAAFDLEHWQTPAVIDSVPFDVVSQSARHASFRKETQLTNWLGKTLDVRINRTVYLIDDMGIGPIAKGVRSVAYMTENTIGNIGAEPWRKESGLLSIWILGMFKHSDHMTVVVPFHPGPVDLLGPEVNDAYFGKVPEDRLKIGFNVLYFKADGKRRSKIGIGPQRARNVLGSYDPGGKLLTVVMYNQPSGVQDYVNSMWELQTEPYGGDVVNSYNDGPPAPGKKPLGPFYELETSSPAAALNPNESITHVHTTMHFQGPESDLDPLARKLLGVSLEDIKNAL